MQAVRIDYIQGARGFPPLKEEVVICSSVPSWRIPRTEEPGRLQSRESQRVGHDGAQYSKDEQGKN